MHNHDPHQPQKPSSGPCHGATPYTDYSLSGLSTPVSMEGVIARSAPAQLSLKGIPLEDALLVLGEAILPHEDLDLSTDQAKEWLSRTARSEPLDKDHLAPLAPRFGDLLIRQVTTLTGADRKLSEKTGLEFSVLHPLSRGCSVTLAPAGAEGACDLTIDWDGGLSFQSDFSVSERWEFVREVLISVGDIDAATCKTRPLDAERKRFQLEESATVEVVDRELLYANPILDPHLSQRPDIIPLCALNPFRGPDGERGEEDTESDEDAAALSDADERLIRLHFEIAKICAKMPSKIDLEQSILTRDQLAHLGDRPFLPNPESEIALIIVDDFLLVVTKASTGVTLLEDLAALERYKSKIFTLSEPPPMDTLRSIESTEFSVEKVASLLEVLELPTKDYFAAAMKNFVDHDGSRHIEQIKDGLLDAVLSGKPATVILAREFLVEGLDSDEEEEEEEGEDVDPWTVDPDAVQVFRTAAAIPTDGASYSFGPAVSFIPGYTSELDDRLESEFTGDSTLLALSVPSNRAGVEHIPVAIARKALETLGHDPASLDVIGALADPEDGSREGYLSKTVRVQF